MHMLIDLTGGLLLDSRSLKSRSLTEFNQVGVIKPAVIIAYAFHSTSTLMKMTCKSETECD